MGAGESGTFRLGHLAELVGGRVDGDASVEVAGIDGLRHAAPGQLSFVADPQYTRQVPETDATA
ncbi:MAG: LpxD N-terminal domain-containing protein, partial [bacterium]